MISVLAVWDLHTGAKTITWRSLRLDIRDISFINAGLKSNYPLYCTLVADHKKAWWCSYLWIILSKFWNFRTFLNCIFFKYWVFLNFIYLFALSWCIWTSLSPHGRQRIKSNPPNVHKTEVYTMWGWPMHTFLALTSIVGSKTGNLPWKILLSISIRSSPWVSRLFAEKIDTW